MIAGIGLSSDLPGAARATAYRVNLSNVAIKEATASNIVDILLREFRSGRVRS